MHSMQQQPGINGKREYVLRPAVNGRWNRKERKGPSLLVVGGSGNRAGHYISRIIAIRGTGASTWPGITINKI